MIPGILDFVPMQDTDLEWVAAQDQRLYPFPWEAMNFTDSMNFADSMRVGYGCWVMREGAERVGYAVQMMVLDEVHLLNFSVMSECQGRGLGRCLLDHLAATARAAGARQMFLEVRPSNVLALALYRRAGFEIIGRRKGYYPAVDGREDALVMRCSL